MVVKIVYDLIDEAIEKKRKEIEALESAKEMLKDLEEDAEIKNSIG